MPRIVRAVLVLVALMASAAVAPAARAASAFVTSGSMSIVREQGTATTLPDGTVLLAGGRTGTIYPTGTAERYDPATGAFRAPTALQSSRYAFTATLLPGGKVLLAGGRDASNTPSRTAELYDPTTGTSTATPLMVGAHASHTATLLPNGRVLIAGGGGSSAAELYDPVANTWTATGSMSTARDAGAAVLLPSGKVLVTGGVTVQPNPVATAELYDPATGTFSPTGTMLGARSTHTATLLSTGKVLLAGGQDERLELYDPASGTFAEAGTLGVRRSPTATTLPDGKVLVVGGAPSLLTDRADVYNPATGLLAATARLRTARANHQAALLAGGEVLIAGGRSTDGSGTERLTTLTAALAATPAAPDGAAGSYATAPTASITTNGLDASIRCEDTPTGPVPSADALPTGPCAYADPGASVPEGSRRICFAAANASGATAVDCAAFVVDTLPPTVTCPTPPTFVQGSSATLTGTVTDAGAGPESATAGAAADTASPGPGSVQVTGRDRVGRSTTVACAFDVQAAPAVGPAGPAAPPVPPVRPPAALCGAPLTLTSIVLSGNRVRLAGFGRPALAGRSVTVVSGGRAVGTAVLAADGAFSTSVKAPSRRARGTVRYQAVLAGDRSRALKLERRLTITSLRGTRVTGRVSAPRRLLPTRVTFYRQLTCSQRRVVASARLRRDGTFSVTLARPMAPEPVAIYRVSAALKRGSTYTLPIAIR